MEGPARWEAATEGNRDKTTAFHASSNQAPHLNHSLSCWTHPRKRSAMISHLPHTRPGGDIWDLNHGVLSRLPVHRLLCSVLQPPLCNGSGPEAAHTAENWHLPPPSTRASPPPREGAWDQPGSKVTVTKAASWSSLVGISEPETSGWAVPLAPRNREIIHVCYFKLNFGILC